MQVEIKQIQDSGFCEDSGCMRVRVIGRKDNFFWEVHKQELLESWSILGGYPAIDTLFNSSREAVYFLLDKVLK